MKIHRSRDRRRSSLIVCTIVASVLMIAVGAVAVSAGGAIYVPNQYIVKATPGATMDAVRQALGQIGGSLDKPLPLPDTYLATMGKTRSTARTVSLASSTPTQWPIKGFFPNYLYHLSGGSATPNDPVFPQQWNMGNINMPKAWAVQKGSASVTVAVVDSGVANHPDLSGRVLQGYDFIDNDADPSNDHAGHGTFCAGLIAAQGNNGMGVCGVCWNGVNIMPIRVFDVGPTSTDLILQGLNYAKNNAPDVVSMSFGYQGSDTNVHQMIVDMYNAGIILVASAGNDGLSGYPNTSIPAAYEECIAVSATGPNDEFAPYSSWGPGNEVDIAAPGGDSTLGPPGYITSTTVTWPNGFTGAPSFGYDNMLEGYPAQGTSFSCPEVAGAAALLLSQGVRPSDVRDRLTSTARQPRTGMNVQKFGAGILDVGAALANGSVTLVKPVKGSTVIDYPDFKISVTGLDDRTYGTLAVYVDYADADGDHVPDDLTSSVLTGQTASSYLNATKTAYLFSWTNVSHTPLAPGLHTIYISAVTSAGDPVSDWGTFSVASNFIGKGTHLISLPYGSAINPADGLRHPLPQQLLWDSATSQPLDFQTDSPARAKLIRWSALDSNYFYYLPGSDNLPSGNDRSWINLNSPGFDYAPNGGGFVGTDITTLQFPVGSGFWLILQQDAIFSNAFPAISATAGVTIPLYKGWNLIGNPFTRQVALSTIKLKYQGQTRTLSDDQKALNHWVQGPTSESSQFFGYSTEGIPGYVAVPWRGVLEPYEGYWIRALVGGSQPQDRLVMTVQ